MASRFKTMTLEEVTELKEAAENLKRERAQSTGLRFLRSGVTKIALRKTWIKHSSGFSHPCVNKTEPITNLDP